MTALKRDDLNNASSSCFNRIRQGNMSWFAPILFLLSLSVFDVVRAGESAVTKRHFRLVCVRVPAESPLRNLLTINHPPKAYLILKRNGVRVGGCSSVVEGWEADFPENEACNVWEIELGSNARYSIELWDDNWGFDDQILSIIELRGESFQNVIRENGPKGLTPDRLVTVMFEPVTPAAP